MTRHSFIQMSKLSNVKGRISYITSHARQENLYATYRTADNDFWSDLAKECQQEFKRSGADGKCIEARELIIALPEVYTAYEPQQVLEDFTEEFRRRYNVECVSALHHNKKKTNYHIHLIFSERRLLAEPDIKIATRSVFYDETGKRVRTKKEIADENGRIRVGCTVIPKGGIYEQHLFTVKDDRFKGEPFLDEVKRNYTDLINRHISDPEQRLKVFDPDSIYLPTKKIGKNNPKAAEIEADNAARQEWNRTADMALISGIEETKILEIKKEEIHQKASQSIKTNGWLPNLFRNIVSKAKEFLQNLIRQTALPPKPILNMDMAEFRTMQLYSEYYGEYSDYTRKGGVICSDILLPSHAPPEYTDRQTLWNAVEKAERGKNAQLAYSFDIALQNEFSLEENIALARQFLLENFVSRGMVVDFAVHQPDREDGGIPNPHFHVLCPIRPIEQDGKWGLKQRRVYELDEDGNRIRDADGNYIFNAVPTTDWGSPETLEYWRQTWAEMCNAKFAEKGLDVRIDHRSYERQGVELLPTVHEGATVRAMEKKGIRTEKGEFNRWIRATNAVIRDIKKKIASLIGWIADMKAELSKPQTPDLISLLNAYYSQRNAGAYSQKGKVSNLKELNETFNYLRANGIYTLEDLENRVNKHNATTESLKKTLDGQTARMKAIRQLYDSSAAFRSLKPIYDGLQKIKFEKPRAKYKAEHADELKMFYAARRKLTEEFPDGKVDMKKLSAEYDALEQAHETTYGEFKTVRDDLHRLWKVKSCVDTAARFNERTEEQMLQNRPQTRHKKEDISR